jgi:hypothetical protein
MKLQSKLAVIAATVALGALSAVGLGATGVASGHPKQSTTHTTGSGQPTQAKAYGRFCQSESKQHVAGTPGTPFSKCVTDMAKLANGSSTNPAEACQNESRRHVAGQRGTPYSVCVSGAKQLLKARAGR